MFFLDSLRQAIGQDKLFGEDFFERMQPKALVTRDGVEDLIHQCLELDIALSHPSSPDVSSPEVSVPASPVIGPCGGTPGIRLKRSRMARKQMKLKVEEEQWMESMLKQVWDTLQPPDTMEMRDMEPESLDKAGPAVAVSEITPLTA
jgi:hypothetical protein